MSAGQELNSRAILAGQANNFSLGLEETLLDSAIITPELAGWQIPVKKASAIFKIATETSNAIKEFKSANPDVPVEKATLHIGQPPTFPKLRQAQIKDLWQLKEGATHFKHSNPTIQSAVDLIEAVVVPNMAKYCSEGGAPNYRKYVHSQFSGKDNVPLFAEKEMTVVSGGPQQSLYFIRELLKQSIPGEASADEYVEVDARGGNIDWDRLLQANTSLRDQGKYIHIIIQDGSLLDDEKRDRIRDFAGGGRVIITDMVNQGFDEDRSLAMDKTMAGLVLTVDDSNLARATGTSAVLGYHKLVSSIEGLHAQRTGTPSTTQQDLALYLSDPETRAAIRNLDNSVIYSPKEESSNFLRELMFYLKKVVDAVDLDEVIDEETDKNWLTPETEAGDLEDRYQEIYGKLFPNQTNAVSNGGGRWGLFQTFEYLHVKDKIDTLVVIPPRFKDKTGEVKSGGYWTYADVAPQMEIKALEKCYNDDGSLNQEQLTEELKSLSELGKRIVVVDQSGGHNPSGLVRSRGEKEIILKAIETYNKSDTANYEINLVDDAAYIDLVYSDVSEDDRLTYAQLSHIDRPDVTIHSVLTGSKGPAQAGARYNTVFSKDEALIKKIRVGRKKQTLNTLGIMMAAALFDPDEYEARRALLVENVEARVQSIAAVLQTLGRDIGGNYKARGAFYPLAQDGWIAHGENAIYRALQLARKRCGIIPLALLNGDQDLVRFAAGGDKTPNELVNEVLFVNRSEDELALAA